MKKIGILTYHDINNYGAQLQAASLSNFLKNHGYDCEIINYKPPRSRLRILGTCLKPAVRFDVSEFKVQLRKRLIYTRSARALGNLNGKSLYTLACVQKAAQKYDFLICGSDELWNFSNYLGYQAPYILDFESFGKKISYAASMGSCKPDEIISKKIQNSLKSFSKILVRDQYTADFLKANSIVSEIVVDPTYLVDIPAVENKAEPYIMVSGALNSKQVTEVFKAAELLSLKVLTPGYVYKGHEDCFVEAGPQEWIGYIKNARYHITSLFHGAAYSIKYKTKFGIFLTPGKESKIKFMIDLFGLGDRLINVDSQAELILEKTKREFSDSFDDLKEKIIKESGKKLLDALSH